MQLSNGKVTQTNNLGGSSHCTKIIESGIFKWKFKIDECNNGAFILGIWKCKNKAITPPLATWFTRDVNSSVGNHFDAGYGFYSKNSCLTDEAGQACGKEYAITPPNGAIIEMILDLNQLTLSYVIDDTDFGKAFDVEKIKYRAAVFFYRKGDAITLLKD